jgi:holo-[acyl-carrier protein] synthase|tara:strand:+ start:402 stop:785 length:384 start_codon:yes stop_codon:yes gene_type:complete
MKIYGIGTDIININRIKKSLKNKDFKKRLFCKNEIVKCNKQVNKDNCYAKRFAAKEAFSKAIGLGISKGLSFNEISIINNKNGKPEIKLTGKTKKIVNKIFKTKKINIYLTLSDDEPFASATVIISI